MALSVSEDGVPTFATMISKEAETAELEARSGATFTDLRVGLFLVNEKMAHELSKVRSSVDYTVPLEVGNIYYKQYFA